MTYLEDQDNKDPLQCRRGTGEASKPRAEKFGDLITADHKVLNEEGESRNNHRYAVVVQDFATQRIQSNQCKTKTSQETEKSLRTFFEPSQKPKVICTDKTLEFAKSCEDQYWNHRTSTLHRSETNGIAGRAVRRMKGGTSAELQDGYGGCAVLFLSQRMSVSRIVCCEQTERRDLKKKKKKNTTQTATMTMQRRGVLQCFCPILCGLPW